MIIQSYIKSNHYFLKVANEIDSLLSPLKRFGISMLTFYRTYKDGSEVYLCNKAGWIQDYYSTKLYCNFVAPRHEQYEHGVITWPAHSDLEVFRLAREKYDSDHGITLCRTTDQFTDLYFFSGSVQNHFLHDFYANHLPILEMFILYFQDRASKLIENAEKHRLILPENLIKPKKISSNHWQNLNEDVQQALTEMRLNKFKINLPGLSEIKLSAREVECIIALNNGHTSKEIGRLLGLSYRTIERYIDSIKDKLGCNSKREVLDIARDSGLALLTPSFY